MIRQDGLKLTSSPKVRVGEIDTSAPFQSVKDAVSLFGVRAFSAGKPSIKQVKQHSAESAYAKETQLHLAEKELNKLKEQLKYAENTKAEALEELEKARRSAKELTERTRALNESKDIALKLTESAKLQAKRLEEANSGTIFVNTVSQTQELEYETKQYADILEELDAAKRELAKIRHDYGASLEEKTFSDNKIEEAELAAKTYSARAQQISNQICDAREMSEQVKRLTETMSEINTLQKEMENVKESDMESLRSVTYDVDVAKESLQKVLKEESGLKKLVESLKCELDSLRKKEAEKAEELEAFKRSESEARTKLEAAEKEIVDTKTATEEAVKRAEMDEAAKKAIEGELSRLRERERKKASEETDGRVKTETIREVTKAKDSPIRYKFQKQKSEMWLPTKKLERRRTYLPRKASIPHLGGIFRRKKSQVAEAASPSYLPGESPC